ncbi:hypothetical protein [Nocardiopsis tropica]|uniref:DUF3618 domain-containing protein n=1 Tax=Nocardiopsis tropica TaxID=109330 RepID=A0ABU7KLX9_9ACTN|nr:hypothetical protein [Nocardiopsis umidischolae]MEE2050300.1 hypothetical protein [Nocardiopsis umidischolae]
MTAQHPSPPPLPPDPFSGVITARDVYDVVRETQGDVRRSLDRLTTVETTQADHETRLRALERWRWGTGAALVLAALTFLGGDSPLSSLIP